MIEGVVKHLADGSAIVMTASGVAYEARLPLPAFCALSIGQSVCLWTVFVARDDTRTLCGFLSLEDRQVFAQLIKISGIGVSMALAMLSTMQAHELAHCVEQGDEAALIAVPGVGKKTAQRLLIELKGKFKNVSFVLPDASLPFKEYADASDDRRLRAEAKAALMALGYKEKEAERAVALAAKETEALDIQSLLKAALKRLSVHK